MKFKYRYTALFLLVAACQMAVLIHHPNLLFQTGSNQNWNLIRSGLLSAMVGGLVTGVAFAVGMRGKLMPYFLKIYRYRSLLYQLVRRDFMTKYKRSVLGVLWSVLNPLLTMLVLTVVFSTLFRFDIDNYPVYLLSGQIVFTLFSESTNMGMMSVLGASALMKKVSVPKYIFPISKALSSLINFAFSLIALMFVMLVTHAPFHINMLLMIVPLCYVFVFSVGFGLLLSAVLVFFRDINYLYGILITGMTYLTPLFYPISIIPDRIRWLISVNPMYHFVECFRTVAIYGGVPTLWQNVICLLFALLSLGLGLLAFYKKQDQFILYI